MVQVNRTEILQRLRDDPEFRQAVWRRIPEAERFAVGEAFRSRPDLFVDSARIQKLLFELVGEKKLETMVERAKRIAPGAAVEVSWKTSSSIADAIPVSVSDVAGADVDVLLKGRTDSQPVVLHSRDLVVSSHDGLYRFRHPETDDVIFVYNAAKDPHRTQTDTKDLLGGRLPAHHVFSALAPQTIFTDDQGERVRLLSRVKVKGVSGFDSNRVYAGYAVRPLTDGRWIPFRDLAWIEGAAVKDGSGTKIRIHNVDGGFDVFELSFLKRLLSSLREKHYVLRGLGAVVNLFDAASVNRDTGEVIINPGAKIHVLDIDLFAAEDGFIRDPEVDGSFLDPHEEFIPGIAPRALADEYLAVTWSHIQNMYGHRKRAAEGRSTESVFDSMINDLAMGQATLRMLRYGNANEAERAAFCDYLMEYIDTKIWRWTRAGAHVRDARATMAEAEGAQYLSATWEVFLHSFRAQVEIAVFPPAIANDKIAESAYDESLSMIGESLNDDDQLMQWHDLFKAYYLRHGMAQLSMFFAKEVPLLMLKSEAARDGSFFDLVGARIASFDPRKEVLSWKTFGNELRTFWPPDGDPTGTDGPYEGEGIGGVCGSPISAVHDAPSLIPVAHSQTLVQAAILFQSANAMFSGGGR